MTRAQHLQAVWQYGQDIAPSKEALRQASENLNNHNLLNLQAYLKANDEYKAAVKMADEKYQEAIGGMS